MRNSRYRLTFFDMETFWCKLCYSSVFCFADTRLRKFHFNKESIQGYILSYSMSETALVNKLFIQDQLLRCRDLLQTKIITIISRTFHLSQQPDYIYPRPISRQIQEPPRDNSSPFGVEWLQQP